MALNGLVAANNLSDVVDGEKAWDNIGDNISVAIPIPSPTLDLDFATNKSLVDNVSGNNLITFNRASVGTFIGSNGLIQTAASGVPRFTHSPTTKASLGLLSEGARTNLLLRSTTLDNSSYWGVYESTVTQDSTISPTGQVDAYKITLGVNPTGSYQGIIQGLSLSLQNYYTFSCFVKAGSQTVIRLGESYSFGYSVTADLSAKTITTSGGFVVDSGIEEYPNGWFRIYGVWDLRNFVGSPYTVWDINLIVNSASGLYAYVWGPQLEGGGGPTSYIPTTTAAVTRAADIASISGANLSSWYNQAEGTVFAEGTANSIAEGGMMWDLNPNATFDSNVYLFGSPTIWGLYVVDWPSSFSGTVVASKAAKTVAALKTNNSRLAANGLLSPPVNGPINPAITTLYIANADYTGTLPGVTYNLNGPIKRLTYYPVRLTDVAIQGLSTYGPVSSFPYSMSIKGRDILALREVNKVSTRDFVFIKGLFSAVQPRITTASQYTASGVALRDAAMLKIAPTTRGNYFFSSGLTLSGVSCQINGTNARSIATSPFSGSGSTVPLLLAGLRPQANWRISEAMASGTVTAPETAIPIETSDFVLFIKAGQN